MARRCVHRGAARRSWLGSLSGNGRAQYGAVKPPCTQAGGFTR